MATKHAKVGDLIELGTCIGNGMEPGYREGRLVGIVHRPEREIERMKTVQTGLAERGIILHPKDAFSSGYSTDLIMTLADGEALLERLDEAPSQFGDH